MKTHELKQSKLNKVETPSGVRNDSPRCADDGRRERENMKSKKYIETAKKINNKQELERLLSCLENDMDVSDRNYESIRTLILKKIYL